MSADARGKWPLEACMCDCVSWECVVVCNVVRLMRCWYSTVSWARVKG